MLRTTYIERLIRQVYGDQPNDDAAITFNLVNTWINEGIGIAVKKNYTDTIQLDGVAYINNSFYSTYKGLIITEDEPLKYVFTLPELPIAIGRNEGLVDVVVKDEKGKISYPIVLLSENEKSYQRGRRQIPNRLVGYYENNKCYILTLVPLNLYTATVSMVSGSSETDLTTQLNVPADYLPLITDYVIKNLQLMRKMPQDESNDGVDKP
jgi:hypothetical protein